MFMPRVEVMNQFLQLRVVIIGEICGQSLQTKRKSVTVVARMQQQGDCSMKV